MPLKLISENKIFDGWHRRYSHHSKANQCDMAFAVYFPPQYEKEENLPVVYWLSGLTCTDENFMQKAGAQRCAAQLGLVIVAPDTSPRGNEVPDDPDQSYDFGLGAGFYINAKRKPWSHHYNMYDYVVEELPTTVEKHFKVSQQKAICGHSMGGHGALSIGLKNIGRYQSISAFSPICNPMNCPWGEKAFSHYLGDNKELWKQYDSCELLKGLGKEDLPPILIDQGSQDVFLEKQLKPDSLKSAAEAIDYSIQLRIQHGYDHSYFFIVSFIEEHLQFHATHLKKL